MSVAVVKLVETHTRWSSRSRPRRENSTHRAFVHENSTDSAVLDAGCCFRDLALVQRRPDPPVAERFETQALISTSPITEVAGLVRRTSPATR